MGTEPTIWRRLMMPETCTLEQLHRVIQLSFAWLDYHLYSFRVGEREFQRPEVESEGEDAAKTSLRSLGIEVGTLIEYTYDFGDDWVHTILVEEAEAVPPDSPYAKYPAVLGGERAAPPEDAGGPHRYQVMLEALTDPTHAEHADVVEWLPKGFDPSAFSVEQCNHAILLARAWGAI